MKQNSIPGFLVVLVLTLGMVAGGGYMWYEQNQQINSYESTEATVMSSEVDRGSDPGEYYPDITYEYTVDGQTYRNSNFEPGAGRVSKSRSRAEEIAENRPDGETITVYYDPENPSDAYVVQNRNVVFPLLSAFGVVCVFATLYGLYRKLTGAPM